MTEEKIIIQDETFIKYLTTTIQDFINVKNIEMVNDLSQMLISKELTAQNMQQLVELILLREENLDSIVLQQDKKIYDLINEEHLYMKNYLNQYFSFSIMKDSGFISIIRK